QVLAAVSDLPVRWVLYLTISHCAIFLSLKTGIHCRWAMDKSYRCATSPMVCGSTLPISPSPNHGWEENVLLPLRSMRCMVNIRDLITVMIRMQVSFAFTAVV